jgi:general secretion pathway protein E
MEEDKGRPTPQQKFTGEPKLLSKLFGLRYEERLADPSPPRNLKFGEFDRIAGSWGKQFSTIPIGESGEKVIVATSDPLNTEALDQIKLCYGRPIEVVVTSPEEVTRAINNIRSRLMSDRSDALDSKEDDTGSDFNGQLKIDVTDAEDDDAPIIRYLNSLIFKANSERASDVHIEPFEQNLKVRFRIDGVLKDVATEDKNFQASIASRIKVMAGLNIAEKRLPQDGRIGLKIAGKDVDIRVSTVPTQFGERIVMRMLDKSSVVLDLEQLGMASDKLKVLQNLITRPHGIILVTGPTGSGKTTTLYACLHKINTPKLNILTVEDPIEYQLDGVGQMQVNAKINFTFASGLRAILRQDPDVVMLGEIRDAETAEIAIQASLTGHLVLSTLHTNDSPGSISRLLDIGIEPFLVSSSLLGVVAQRLIRKLCGGCAITYEISDAELRELGINPFTITNRAVRKASAEGCANCRGTGYRGRGAIHELLVIDDDIRSLILQRTDAGSIRAHAMTKGFRTLRMDGAEKIFNGFTSVEEILRVTLEVSDANME